MDSPEIDTRNQLLDIIKNSNENKSNDTLSIIDDNENDNMVSSGNNNSEVGNNNNNNDNNDVVSEHESDDDVIDEMEREFNVPDGCRLQDNLQNTLRHNKSVIQNNNNFGSNSNDNVNNNDSDKTDTPIFTFQPKHLILSIQHCISKLIPIN